MKYVPVSRSSGQTFDQQPSEQHQQHPKEGSTLSVQDKAYESMETDFGSFDIAQLPQISDTTEFQVILLHSICQVIPLHSMWLYSLRWQW